MKVSYNKPHLTYQQQRIKLEQQGMLFDGLSFEQIEHYLAHYNYYRLAGYWHDRLQSDNCFKPDTLFSEIISLYQFDKELRILLLYAIEQIEVSLRSKLAYHLGDIYGSHPLLKPEVFHAKLKYAETLTKLKTEIARSSEEFIKHLTQKYSEEIPPIWACVEVMSLGQLSSWYKNLKKRSDAKIISDDYQLDSKVLASFLHHVTILRNHCAHHARVWNKSFTFAIELPEENPKRLVDAFQKDSLSRKKLYNTLVMMNWMLNIIQPDHDWTHRLLALLAEYPTIQTRHMGFPQSWRNHPIWSQA